MKQINRFVAVGSMLSFLFFTSCRKQIEEPIANEITPQSSTITSTICRPAIYGMYNTNNGEWTTIAQKWYSGEKIQFIKTHFSGHPASSLYLTEPILNIDWGEVTYEGNQVRVWDQAQNRLVFRATLDESGKPVASYLYNQAGTGMFIDTSYYYYNGDRLNYIIQLFENRSNGVPTSRGWEQYTFVYNNVGNLTQYSARNDESVADFISGSAVSGLLADYVLTTAFRMLEYLELTKLPLNSTLSEMRMTRQHGFYPPFVFYSKSFYNYAITDGLVRSYLTPLSSGIQNYYIGWDCGGTISTNSANRQNNAIMTIDQFKKLYGAANK